LKEDSCLIYVICVCLRIVVSNTYCVVCCVFYVATFDGTGMAWAKKKTRLPQIKDHAMNRVDNTFCTVTGHHIQHTIENKCLLCVFTF
jgi:hypothetical protein